MMILETKSKVIKTRTAEIWKGEDGVVRLTHTLDNAEVVLVDIRENLNAVRTVGGEKNLLLVDIRKIKSTDREGRAYGITPEGISTYMQERSLSIPLLVR